jgi:hypothetical protein
MVAPRGSKKPRQPYHRKDESMSVDLEVATYFLDCDHTGRGPQHVTLEAVYGFDGKRWAVREAEMCLNKSGGWEWEPQPSSRDDEFYARCRWATAEEALAFWRERGCASRFRQDSSLASE